MVFNKRGRRKRKSLREEFLSSKACVLKNRIDENQTTGTGSRLADDLDYLSIKGKEDNFLSSTPATLKGSFLRNKLDNPLFKSFHFSKSRNFSISSVNSLARKSALKKVTNASDDEESEGELDEDVSCSEEDEDFYDNRVGRENKPRNKFLDASRLQNRRRSSVKSVFRAKKLSSTGHISRFSSSFLFPRRKEFTRKRGRTRNRRNIYKKNSISSDSNTSRTSFYSGYDSDAEVDTLTRLEESQKSPLSGYSSDTERSNDSSRKQESYLLYTHKGDAVRLQFFFDYLLISPVCSKLSLSLSPVGSRSKNKPKPKIVYYEDLASWTNNANCLRLIHIRNKNTAQQDRSEIKLFLNKKKVTATPQELNDLLKDRVSVLIAGKMNCDVTEARKMLERNVTEDDVKKVVQRIDKSGERCLAESYTKDLVQSSSYALYNV